MQHIILLDIDGVVVPNCPLVAQSIERYVSRHCRVSLKQARRLNQRLYRRYGHSYTGLQQVHALEQSLTEFNTEVYSDILGGKEWLDSLPLERCADVTNSVRLVNDLQVNVYAFSNAPESWCEQMLTKVELQNIVQMLDVPCLKPHPRAYEQVVDSLSEAGRTNCHLHYIDDSFSNLLPIFQKLLP